MTKIDKMTSFSRRNVLQGTGALVISVGMPIAFDTVLGVTEAVAQNGKPPLTPDQLSSFIAVNADGSVSAFCGKMDMGLGIHTAMGQIVADWSAAEVGGSVVGDRQGVDERSARVGETAQRARACQGILGPQRS